MLLILSLDLPEETCLKPSPTLLLEAMGQKDDLKVIYVNDTNNAPHDSGVPTHKFLCGVEKVIFPM